MKFGFEDVVFRRRKNHFVIGIVSETIEDAPDVVSSDEDDDEEYARVKEGQCRVAWLPKGNEKVEQEDKLFLGDRSVMPGDVVELSASPGRKGYCLRVRVNTSVRPIFSLTRNRPLGPPNWILMDIPSSRLERFLEFSEGYAVSYGGWLGTIRRVGVRIFAKVHVPWDKVGADRRCAMSERAARDLEEIGPNKPSDIGREYELETCPFRPGQKFSGTLKYVNDHCTWLSAAPPSAASVQGKRRFKKSRDVTLTLYDVRTDYITVTWTQGTGNMPAEKLSGDTLAKVKMMNVYEDASLQVGRLARLVVEKDDRILSAEEWEKVLQKKAEQVVQETANNSVNGDANDEESTKVASKKSDAAFSPDSSGWTTDTENEADETATEEEGEKEKGAEASGETVSKALKAAGEKEKKEKHGGVVVGLGRKKKGGKGGTKGVGKAGKKPGGSGKDGEGAGAGDDADQSGRPLPGEVLVVETVFTESDVDVKWQDNTVESIRSNALFPIEHLDEHECFPGDFVFPVAGTSGVRSCGSPLDGFGCVESVDHKERTAIVTWYKYCDKGPDDAGKLKAEATCRSQEVSVYDLNEHPELDFRLGTVVTLRGQCSSAQVAGRRGPSNSGVTSGVTSMVSGIFNMLFPGAGKNDAPPEVPPEVAGAIVETEEEQTVKIDPTKEKAEVKEAGTMTEGAVGSGSVGSGSVVDQLVDAVFSFGNNDAEAMKARRSSQPNLDIGQVVDFLEKEGKMLIQWGNGKTTVCWPHELKRIGDYDSDENELWGDGGDYEGEEGSSDESSDESSSTSTWSVDKKGKKPDDDEGEDDSWETASEEEEESEDVEYHPVGQGDHVGEDHGEGSVDGEGGSDEEFVEDPNEPGTHLETIKSLPPHWSAKDYSWVIGGRKLGVASLPSPPVKIYKKKYCPKVRILERVRDRLFCELCRYPPDSEPAVFKKYPATVVAAMCKDCVFLDEMMFSKHFRARSLDAASFPRLRRAVDALTLGDESLFERLVSRLPEVVRFLSHASLQNAESDLGRAYTPAEMESVASEIFGENAAPMLAAANAVGALDTKPESMLVVNVSKLKKRDREDVAKVLEDSMKFKQKFPLTSNLSLETNVPPPGALTIAASIRLDTEGAGGKSRKTNYPAGDVQTAVVSDLPAELVAVFFAWCRDRLFNATVSIVTDYGSNVILEREQFYPEEIVSLEGIGGGGGAGLSERKDEAMDQVESREFHLEPERGPEGEPDDEPESEPTTPLGNLAEGAQSFASPQVIPERGSFEVVETAPQTHKYYSTASSAISNSVFNRAVMREMKLLRTSLPRGIHVRAFEDRRDLFSAMIEGPASTPYEGGLFFFDAQLPETYPNEPPKVHYIHYGYSTGDRLNPNLYVEGKVCVSLLGTWDGRGSELWTKDSSLLQVLVSIQGLILNKEPYYNEAGYERQRGERLAVENSKKYNEMASVKVIQAMAALAGSGLPTIFKDEIMAFLKKNAWKTIKRYETWMSDENRVKEDGFEGGPEFPLMPLTRGFVLPMARALGDYQKAISDLGIAE